jgi:hypothetical protein
MKVVKNNCYGGFSLSHAAVMRYAELTGKTLYAFLPSTKSIDAGPVPYDGITSPPLGLIFYCTKKKYSDKNSFNPVCINRSDKYLVQVVEELGKKANGKHAKLVVVKIPNNVKWEIDDYDGMETIHEKHRTW